MGREIYIFNFEIHTLSGFKNLLNFYFVNKTEN